VLLGQRVEPEVTLDVERVRARIGAYTARSLAAA